MTPETSQVIIASLGIFSSGAIIKLIQHYFRERKAKREGYLTDGIAFRKNLIKRLKEVEKKEDLNSEKILKLTAKNSILQTKLDNLEGYNNRLIKKLDECEKEKTKYNETKTES